MNNRKDVTAHDVKEGISNVYNTREGLLRLLQVNCRSIYNKVHQLNTLVDSSNADIVIGTESWLKEEVSSLEVFPKTFEVYRRDREGKGGGVFI